MPPPTFLQPLGHGITAIDTGFVRDRFDAAYLMVHGGRAAFIDAGINSAVPRLLAALDHAGVAPDAVDHVIVTHVHLDHAGGAGLLMQHLPRARLVVHPRGARHMVDPSALVAGARAVYGDDEVARTYGAVQPVPADRVVQTHDGMVIDLAGRPLGCIDTPGHARHHHCIWDAASGGWFAGDTFGLAYPELLTPRGPYVLPTTTPVQFEPAALKQSIARLLETAPTCIYLTHYGRLADPAAAAPQLLEQIDAMVALAVPLRHVEDRHARLKAGLAALYTERLRRMGSPLARPAIEQVLAGDLELNAQGLGVWLDRPSTP